MTDERKTLKSLPTPGRMQAKSSRNDKQNEKVQNEHPSCTTKCLVLMDNSHVQG